MSRHLDGTPATHRRTPRNPTRDIGEPVENNIAKLRELVESGYKIVLHTSLPSADYEAIEAWLTHHEIPFTQIITGNILAAIYIDDRGRNADAPNWLPDEDQR
jgi:hypothetical protein